MQKFVLKIVGFSLFMALALYGVKYVMPTFEIVPFYFFSIIFFMLLTILVYSMLIKGLQKGNNKFVYAFYFTTIIRLFGSIVVLLVYFLTNGRKNLYEAVVFIILYFLFTAFEIVYLFPILRPEIKENQNK